MTLRLVWSQPFVPSRSAQYRDAIARWARETAKELQHQRQDMNNIRPLHTLDRGEVRELAHAAAERDEPLQQANKFEPGTQAHAWFELAYQERALQLCDA